MNGLALRGGLLVAVLALGVGCGEVTRLDTTFNPPLKKFEEQVQPALDAQGCGRGPDEEHGLPGCHTPKQGGLSLTHRPDEQQVVINYRNAVPFIDLAHPADSLLLLAPLNGPLPPGGDERTVQVDHPEYAGRFTSATDCCYCKILDWICAPDSTDEACEACRDVLPCDDCKPAVECRPGGAPEEAAEGAALFQRVADAVTSHCGGCHSGSVPPTLATPEDLAALVTATSGSGEPYLTPCEAGGVFLRYVDGNNNDPVHAAAGLDAAQRGDIHLWIEEKGAPTSASSCTPGGDGLDQDLQRFHRAADIITTSCAGCHPAMSPPDLGSEDAIAALAHDPDYVTPCSGEGKLLHYVDGKDGDSIHSILTDEQRQAIHDWIERSGAATP